MEKLNKYTNTAHIAKTNEIVEEVNKLQKNGGKINTVKVNNSPLPITPEDKSVNIDLSGYSPLYHSHRADQVVGLEEKFATTSHNHAMSQITGLDAALAGKSPTGHKHSVQDITGLDSNLANHSHTMTQITGLTDTLADKAPAVHSHKITDVTELNNELNKKSPLYHSHRADEVVGLEEKFASISHNHSVSQITGLANVAQTGNYSDLKNAPTSLSAFINDTKFITKDSDITGNAFTAFRANQDSVGNVIKDTYAKKENIYLYVGKNPIVSELNENTLVIDPDEVNNGTAQPVIDAYTKAESDQKYVVNITGSGGTINVIKGDGSSTPLNVAPPLASQEEALAGTDNTKMMTPLRVKDVIKTLNLKKYANISESNTFTENQVFNQGLYVDLGGHISVGNYRNDRLSFYADLDSVHFGVPTGQSIHQCTSATLPSLSNVKSDCIVLKILDDTLLTFDAQKIFGTEFRDARVAIIVIWGPGTPIINWLNCELYCEPPTKEPNKTMIVTFLFEGTVRHLVSASYRMVET